MKETTENNKFKQTRLIFTPKDDAITGQKRLHADSPRYFNDEEEEDEEWINYLLYNPSH